MEYSTNDLTSKKNDSSKDIKSKKISNTNNDKGEIILKKDNIDINSKIQEEPLITESKRKFIC